MDERYGQRIEAIIDRDEIFQIMLRYARGLDRLDNALVRSCYWDDATDDHGHFVGPPDDFIVYADQTTLMFESTQHGILNHVCDLEGGDAFCETYYQFTGVTAGDAPNFVSTGRYVDHLQKRDNIWRIANRVTIVESQMDLPKAASLAQLPDPYSDEEPCQARRDRGDVSYHRPPIPRRRP